MASILQRVRNTIQYHYYRRKNGWVFPSNMAHTSGARVADGTYEPDLTDCIRRKIQKGATVIDVGANIGYYARLFARMAEKTGTVIAFEAESENYRCLCKNTAAYRQVTPVAMAASNSNALSELRISSHSSCHSMVNTGNYQNKTSVKIPSIKLDLFWDLYLERTNIDCIKIDVEGAEIPVLEGMQEMLSRNAVEMMIIEFCPRIMINASFDPLQLYDRIPPAFTVTVVESEFKDAVENSLIQSKLQFGALKNHLLSCGDFVNCNLLCERTG